MSSGGTILGGVIILVLMFVGIAYFAGMMYQVDSGIQMDNSSVYYPIHNSTQNTTAMSLNVWQLMMPFFAIFMLVIAALAVTGRIL